MSHNEITLFVMPGCNVCPQMEHLFQDMHQNGTVSSLQIMDVTEHAELAKKFNIRSVPYYLINGIAFTGLKSRTEIESLLKQDAVGNWAEKINEDLAQGMLEEVEQGIRDDNTARDAMLNLLKDDSTPLVVRIGLTAIIESVVTSGVLTHYEQAFIRLAEHEDERIATDGLYYLYLLSTPGSLAKLERIAETGRPALRSEAGELLSERLSENWSS